VRVRTYVFPGCFTRPPGTSARNHPHEPTASKPVVPGECASILTCSQTTPSYLEDMQAAFDTALRSGLPRRVATLAVDDVVLALVCAGDAMAQATWPALAPLPSPMRLRRPCPH
jgi:hypothetical protein